MRGAMRACAATMVGQSGAAAVFAAELPLALDSSVRTPVHAPRRPALSHSEEIFAREQEEKTPLEARFTTPKKSLMEPVRT